jgi:hypothetical protein
LFGKKTLVKKKDKTTLLFDDEANKEMKAKEVSSLKLKIDNYRSYETSDGKFKNIHNPDLTFDRLPFTK